MRLFKNLCLHLWFAYRPDWTQWVPITTKYVVPLICNRDPFEWMPIKSRWIWERLKSISEESDWKITFLPNPIHLSRSHVKLSTPQIGYLSNIFHKQIFMAKKKGMNHKIFKRIPYSQAKKENTQIERSGKAGSYRVVLPFPTLRTFRVEPVKKNHPVWYLFSDKVNYPLYRIEIWNPVSTCSNRRYSRLHIPFETGGKPIFCSF